MQVSYRSKLVEENLNGWFKSRIQKKFRYQFFLKYFFGLPFLKPDEVEDCFTDDIISILSEDEKVQQFSDYILNTYIKPICDFPFSVWAMYSRSIIRTTNSCKDFYFKFNSMFYSAHPNIFQFIDVLKNVQKETY
jgi:hypothetical protein